MPDKGVKLSRSRFLGKTERIAARKGPSQPVYIVDASCLFRSAERGLHSPVQGDRKDRHMVLSGMFLECGSSYE